MAKRIKKKKKQLPADQLKFNLLKRLLRGVFRWLPEYREVYNNNRCTQEGHKNKYMCAGCDAPFIKAHLAVDHIEPVGGYYKWRLSGEPISAIVDLVWCNVNNLQLLCKQCHYEKTTKERKINASHKKIFIASLKK